MKSHFGIGCSPVNLTYIFRTPCHNDTFEVLLLNCSKSLFFLRDLWNSSFFIDKGKAANIVENYFNRGINPASKLNLRIFGAFTTKVLYIFANVMVFLLTNILLNGNYQNYGQKWNSWAELNNSMAYDYMGMGKTVVYLGPS